MKYRRLNIEELKELKTAFIRFLAANGISGDEWEKIKESDLKRTDELLDVFSDTAIHETLTKIEYLQIIQPKEIKTFHCLAEQIKLIGLIVDGENNIDFTKMESPQMMAQQIAASSAQLKMYSAEKAYQPEREMELFIMMEGGCKITDGEIYSLLEQLG